MMIRINLLSSKKRSVGNAAWNLVVLLIVVIVAEAGAAYFFYDSKSQEVNELIGQVQQEQGLLTALEIDAAEAKELRDNLSALSEREMALAQLTAIRIGPHHVLDELKRILNKPRSKAALAEVRELGWNVSWESSNLFLEDVIEEEPGLVLITGMAKDNGDIAEFLKRLTSSPRFFQDVDLIVSSQSQNSTSIGDEVFAMLSFEIIASVNFFYITESSVAAFQQLEDSTDDELIDE